MAIRDPVSAYKASSNVEAHLACLALVDSGIEAHVVEDVSMAGAWLLGLLPVIHSPQVWIDRRDLARSQAVLEAFESQAADRREKLAGGDPIVVTCEECGATTMFPAEQIGSVQTCASCHAFVDVPGDAPQDDVEPDPTGER